MGGREALRELRALRPAVRVLVASAFGLEGDASALVAEGAVGLLPKPYRLASLAQAVAQALGHPVPPPRQGA
jgi:CheY-like chemotaxis protein